MKGRLTSRRATGVIAIVVPIALTLAGGASAFAAGTTNGNAGCVAQISTVEGAPGRSVPTLRLYITPVPGGLFSAIAMQDNEHCELP